MIRFGPAGIGGVKEAEKNLEYYKTLGLSSCELAFTYQIYMNNEDAKRIGKKAKELNIQLSIHAPYYINLASKDKIKINQSKKRILLCCERGHYLGVKYVVFHCGFYQERDKEETYQLIKEEILDMQRFIQKHNWEVKLAPETTGKETQFGTVDELLRLRKDTGCFMCVDFSHVYARNIGKIDYKKLFKKLKGHIHAHFSGITYTQKGERSHRPSETERIKELLKHIKGKDITIINESPDPIRDTVKTIKMFSKF